MRVVRFARHRPALRLLASGALVAAILAPALQAQDDGSDPFSRIKWTPAGETVKIGKVAMLLVPENCQFTDGAGSRLFDEANQNIPNPNSLGVLMCDLNPPENPEARIWYAQYAFSDDGYIKDAATEKLDADAILQSVKDGTREANAERKRKGWSTLEVVGWEQVPHYDALTNNATWSIRGRDDSDGSIAMNHRVRILGRRGVLGINMITAPEDYTEAVAAFGSSVDATTFVAGERYAEWREGDKVAQYGLTALIAGGAGVAAGKLGLFGKLWKLIAGLFVAGWKLLVLAVVAIGAKFRSLFGKKEPKAAAG